MNSKICTKCKIEKSFDEFPSSKQHKDGKSSWCKECDRIKGKKYRVEHKEERKIYNKKYYLKNKKKILIQSKKYHLKHKEEIEIYNKKYCLEHKNEINKYYNKRRKTDIRFKILGDLRNRIIKVLRGNNKSLSTMFLIGCEIDYLLYHLQSQFVEGMTWDNHGEWHIDHIKPCASFDLSKESEQHKCFNYTNLQPLWAKDNLTKGVN